MKRLRATIILILSVLAGACSSIGESDFRDQFFAFGTLIDLTIYDVDPARGEQASAWLEQDFHDMHADWHAWQEGKLTAINEQLKRVEPARADAAILKLAREGLRLSELSGGLFNPLIGELVELWGFHDNPLPPGTLPDRLTLASQLALLPTAADIRIEDTSIHSRNLHAQLDFGAFAKGYAIDRGIELLRELGIENAMINAGGDLRAIGRHGDRAWRIGIRHPRRPVVLASIEIEGDASVFTSGDYERFFEVDGKRYHHIIDPRSGYPANTATSATVIHTNAATADAAATALFIAGPAGWPAVAARMGIELAMLIDTEGNLHMNPEMRARIRFEDELDAEVRLVKLQP